MLLTVGVGDMKISNNKDDIIITHALGSCVGITIYDRENFVGGLLHFMLPEANGRENIENPFMYADKALPILFERFAVIGGNIKRSKIKACGGAIINGNQDFFNIGKKNILILKNILWKHNLLLENEDFGGYHYRTLTLFLNDGKVSCKNHIIGEWEI